MTIGGRLVGQPLFLSLYQFFIYYFFYLLFYVFLYQWLISESFDNIHVLVPDGLVICLPCLVRSNDYFYVFILTRALQAD